MSLYSFIFFHSEVYMIANECSEKREICLFFYIYQQSKTFFFSLADLPDCNVRELTANRQQKYIYIYIFFF